jgi:UPF0755 protein
MARPLETPRQAPSRSGAGNGDRVGERTSSVYGRPPRDRYRYPDERRGGGPGGLLRFIIFLVVFAAVVLGVLATVARPVFRGLVVGIAHDNPSTLRIGFIRDIVAEDLGPALTAKASDDSSEVEFVVESGDTPTTIAPRLLAEHLITSERAFLFLATTNDLASQLDAGRFVLRKDMTPQEVVVGLVQNKVVRKTVDITFREGLRLEQLTAKLQSLQPLPVDPEQFYKLVKHPPDSLLKDFPWLADENVHPKGASLEGFLYPATYTLRTDPGQPDDAESLVRMMLEAFHDKMGDDRLKVPAARHLTFYQVLTLASVVEKEVVHDGERKVIAGVYQNRIDRKPAVPHGLLQADPTVIYANDTEKLGQYSDWTQYVFWDPKNIPAGGFKDITFPGELAGYNTYAVAGLPPGPICTPTVASIDAALSPDTKSGFSFFVAIPGDPDGKHDFSKTIAEHQRKLQKYGYIS